MININKHKTKQAKERKYETKSRDTKEDMRKAKKINAIYIHIEEHFPYP